MRVIDIADIIYNMRSETQFVLRCEEVFHDKISAAAGTILSAQPRKPFVCLTGPSGSGKTTTAMRLRAYLENLGVKVCLLSMDNFFLSIDERPPEADDWESPYCVNRPLLLDTIDKLSRGETAQVPWYDFKSGKTGGFTPMEGSAEAVIIAEGIHMLNPLLFDPIRDRATGVYVAPRTRLITADDRMRTNIPNVYVAGDAVSGTPMLAHVAYREGIVAVNNILGKQDHARYDAVPSIVYTNPEVAGVGLTEEQAKASGKDYAVVKLPLTYAGRYVAENAGTDPSICKFIVGKKYHEVLGVHMLGNPCSEIIHSMAIAIENEMTLEQLREVIFPHPTVSEVIRDVAYALK